MRVLARLLTIFFTAPMEQEGKPAAVMIPQTLGDLTSFQRIMMNGEHDRRRQNMRTTNPALLTLMEHPVFKPLFSMRETDFEKKLPPGHGDATRTYLDALNVPIIGVRERIGQMSRKLMKAARSLLS